MSTFAPVTPLKYQASAQGLAEPFMADVAEVFSALDGLLANEKLYRPDAQKPARETVAWAKWIMLRVLPSYYLRGAEIEPFNQEIHATWEGTEKRVVAYFPRPGVLKVYYEQVRNGEVVHHQLRNVDPAGLSAILSWFFKS